MYVHIRLLLNLHSSRSPPHWLTMIPTQGEELDNAPPAIQKLIAESTRLQQRYQTLLDRSTPLVAERWAATGVLLVLFMLRIVFAQGWYIGEYACCTLYLLLTLSRSVLCAVHLSSESVPRFPSTQVRSFPRGRHRRPGRRRGRARSTDEHVVVQ